jgi:hypothetical protein
LITGCARSGTSLIGGLISIAGAWGGKTTGKTGHNRKGQFENSKIREQVTKAYLRENKLDPLGQNPLPDVWNLTPPTFDFKGRIKKILHEQGYPCNGHWYYKGAKMCLLWPLWANAFPCARWIIVRRRDEDIIDSCLRTRFMRAFRDRKGWQGWIDEHKKRFAEMIEAGLDVTIIRPEQILEGNTFAMAHFIKRCGLKVDVNAFREFISPELYHIRGKVNGTNQSNKS